MIDRSKVRVGGFIATEKCFCITDGFSKVKQDKPFDVTQKTFQLNKAAETISVNGRHKVLAVTSHLPK